MTRQFGGVLPLQRSAIALRLLIVTDRVSQPYARIGRGQLACKSIFGLSDRSLGLNSFTDAKYPLLAAEILNFFYHTELHVFF